jgi:hypothetical protein
LTLLARVRAALPSIVTAFQAAEAMSQYARRINCDTKSVNAIEAAKLLLKGKLGTLLTPATAVERGAKGGRGRKASRDYS